MSMRTCRGLLIPICCLLVAAFHFSVQAQDAASAPAVDGNSGTAVAAGPAASDNPTDLAAAPALATAPAITPFLPVKRGDLPADAGKGVDWGGLSKATYWFLGVQHGFRLLTEPGTRAGLKGSFIKNYARSVGNLHGISDGDEFYVNYVGHPMMGSVAGFLWLQNDRAYHHAEFGANRLYWKGRLRAAAFSWAYSAQFEIGPLSEASIGAIQSSYPQQGFVDHAITPAIGMAWMIGEDVVDRYIIKRIEAATENRMVRLLARGGLNPTRTFANAMNGRYPWARDTRASVSSYVAANDRSYGSTAKAAENPPVTGLAPPFEFNVLFQPERFWGGGKSLMCLGGGANAAFRLASSWQLVAQVDGCNLLGLGQNVSGDSLAYTVGPRWLGRIRGPLIAHAQVLVGGNKITQERMYPKRKELLDAAATRNNTPPPDHSEYTDATESHGLTVSTGGGFNYQLNRALTIRVAELSYRHSWTAPLWGRDYSNSLTLSSGLVLQMGTW